MGDQRIAKQPSRSGSLTRIVAVCRARSDVHFQVTLRPSGNEPLGETWAEGRVFAVGDCNYGSLTQGTSASRYPSQRLERLGTRSPRSKKLLGAPGHTARSKDATREENERRRRHGWKISGGLGLSALHSSVFSTPTFGIWDCGESRVII